MGVAVNRYLTTFNIQALKLVELADVLEDVLVLEHDTQIDFLHDIFDTFFL